MPRRRAGRQSYTGPETHVLSLGSLSHVEALTSQGDRDGAETSPVCRRASRLSPWGLQCAMAHAGHSSTRSRGLSSPVRVIDPPVLSAREERQRRPRSTKVRLVGRIPNKGRHPQASFVVKHWIVRRGRRVDDQFAAPVRRGGGHSHWKSAIPRAHVPNRNLDLVGSMLDRVHPHDGVVAGASTEHRPIGVQGRIAFIGGDFVVHVSSGGAPVPLRDHEAPLDARRTRWGVRGDLALLDALGPHSCHGYQTEDR